MTTTALPMPAGSLLARGRAAACIGGVALVSLLAFEAMAVAAVMPAIAAALGGIGGYALAFGGLLAVSVPGMVIAGWWTDRHGARRTTAAGLLVFTAGLLLAGFAPGMGWLVAGRLAQGLGSGMLGVALVVGLGQIVPAALHPRLFAAFAAAWVLPALVGPALAATMAQQLGWRSVFLGVAAAVPLAAALLLPPLGRLPAPAPAAAGVADADRRPRRRVAWAVAAAAGALLLHAAAQAGSPLRSVVALAAGGLIALVAARPLLPVGSLRATRGLPAVIALRALLAAAFATAEVFVPLYLTREAGWSLAMSGLALSTGAIFWSAGSALQSRIEADSARQRALHSGFVVLTAGLVTVLAAMLAGLPAALLVAGWALSGMGIGLAFPMLSVLTLQLSPAAERGRNTSALQLADALGCSVALAFAGALFAAAGAGGALAHGLVLCIAALLAATGAGLARRAWA